MRTGTLRKRALNRRKARSPHFRGIGGEKSMPRVVLLKITQKGEKGFQISSVPMKKLSELAKERFRSWELQGEFLFLRTS